LRFAIEAETADEASTVLTQVLQLLDPPLPLRSQPVIHPRHSHHRDGMWIGDTAPDLTHLQSIEPDDAKTRCRWVETHFPTDVRCAREGPDVVPAQPAHLRDTSRTVGLLSCTPARSGQVYHRKRDQRAGTAAWQAAP